MKTTAAAILGFLLDLLLGDPEGFPHPVVWMGRAIKILEKLLRRIFPKTEKGELLAGSCMALILPLATLGASGLILHFLYRIHPALAFAMGVVWNWQAIAVKDLKKESTNVYRKLKSDSLESAQKAVSRIVGRDTEVLSKEGVTKAAIETVAESFSDGVIAPLFWLLLGGTPLALCYKSINTMDSMVGYKNEKYLYFGRCAAKLDDAANYLPSRLAALLLILSTLLCRENVRNAFLIWRRDRRKHASPNSAQTESVMAGALGIELAGPARYFGIWTAKQTIGDPLRPVEAEDILRANHMMVCGSVLGLLLLCVLRCGILLCFR